MLSLAKPLGISPLRIGDNDAIPLVPRVAVKTSAIIRRAGLEEDLKEGRSRCSSPL